MKHTRIQVGRGWRLAALVAVIGLSVPRWALAQDSEIVVLTAREVAKEGLAAYDAGDFDLAYDKLAQAYGAVKLPTLALYCARSAEASGRFVKAAELYREATLLPREVSWQPGQYEAQEDARLARTELLPRIPRLAIVIDGGSDSPEVELDGVQLPASLIRAEQLVDPGNHTVTVRSSDLAQTREVSVAEGETEQVRFEFPTVSAVVSPVRPTSVEDKTPAPGTLQRTLGWVSIGVGGASVLTGVGFGIYLVWKDGKLDEAGCTSDGHCYSDQQAAVDKFNTRRTISTVTIVAGSVVAASGVALLLTAPKTQGPEVVVRATPNGLLLSGRF